MHVCMCVYVSPAHLTEDISSKQLGRQVSFYEDKTETQKGLVTSPRSHQLSPGSRSPVALGENFSTAVSYCLGTLGSHIPSCLEVGIKKDLTQCFSILI